MQSRAILVLRGDLNSGSGYSRVIQGYVDLFAPRFDVIIGVDIHHHPARALRRFVYPVVSDELAEQALALAASDESLVLNITTPDHFRRFRGHRCVGMFFWETDRIDAVRWGPGLQLMDEIWVPAAFLRAAVAKAGFEGVIKLVRCPINGGLIDLEPATATSESIDIPAFEIGCGQRLIESVTSFAAIRRRYKTIALSINTFIPRKGFPVLAREWSELCAERRDIALVVKLGSIDVTESTTHLVERFAKMFSGVCRGLGLEESHAFVITGNLPEETIERLFDDSDLYVTASFGEGLGIGVFDHLSRGKPAVCPRHTALAELLPADYRYFAEADTTNVDLPDQLGIVPISAKWGIPRHGSLKQALLRAIDDIASGDHALRIAEARQHSLSVSSPDIDTILARA